MQINYCNESNRFATAGFWYPPGIDNALQDTNVPPIYAPYGTSGYWPDRSVMPSPSQSVMQSPAQSSIAPNSGQGLTVAGAMQSAASGVSTGSPTGVVSKSGAYSLGCGMGMCGLGDDNSNSSFQQINGKPTLVVNGRPVCIGGPTPYNPNNPNDPCSAGPAPAPAPKVVTPFPSPAPSKPPALTPATLLTPMPSIITPKNPPAPPPASCEISNWVDQHTGLAVLAAIAVFAIAAGGGK